MAISLKSLSGLLSTWYSWRGLIRGSQRASGLSARRDSAWILWKVRLVWLGFGILDSSLLCLCSLDKPISRSSKSIFAWKIKSDISIGKKQDDLVAALSKEADFASTKPRLQEVLEARGCKVLFGVKFHPELMMIESCYRYYWIISFIEKKCQIVGKVKKGWGINAKYHSNPQSKM